MVELALDLKGIQMPRGAYERAPVEERLLNKIKIAAETGCWEWTASKTRGYAVIRANGRWCRANRVSYDLYCGPIADGMHVLHRCDNPACVNPEHLFLGTNADNMADKVAKGRQLPGSAHSLAKLTDADVLAIRNAEGVTQLALATKYGVGQQQISRIRSGKRWAHLARTEDAGDLLDRSPAKVGNEHRTKGVSHCPSKGNS